MTKMTLSVFLFFLATAAGPGTKRGNRIEDRREQDCRSCHRFTRGLSHALDVRVNLVTGLPLLRGKRMGCQTCHAASEKHGQGDGKARVQLRRSPRELCESCHRELKSAKGKFAHALLVGRAHLETREPAKKGDSRPMDTETRTCLECHDGSVTGDASHSKGRRGPRMQREHPVGVLFRKGRKKGSSLRPRAQLPRTIRLPGGRVGCGSCHSPFSKLDKMLTETLKRGKLCLTCHDM